LVLAYFTRSDEGGNHRFANLHPKDLLRALVLMACAVPVAVGTNAARVASAGFFTFLYGRSAAEGTIHEFSGWLVYVGALAILIGANLLLKRILRVPTHLAGTARAAGLAARRRAPVFPLLLIIFAGGIAINWSVHRGEVSVPRSELVGFPDALGGWRQKGTDFKFGKDVESVLGATDYTMREYSLPDGRIANIYVGYYASQRTGATYHSPQNCLPGAGWVLGDPGSIDITASNGRTFRANRYIIENGRYREIMIYWYQGRGRIEASEYNDKLNTVWDSITRRRTDGAMVRVMTGVGTDQAAAERAAADLSAKIEDQLVLFVPE
jgi:EpsI family protein